MRRLAPWTTVRSAGGGLKATGLAPTYIQRVRWTASQRHEIAEFPIYLLEDIGLTQAEARPGILGAFWDLPTMPPHRW